MVKFQISEGWDGISRLSPRKLRGRRVLQKGPAYQCAKRALPAEILWGTIFVHVGLVQKYHQLHAMPFASHLYLDSWDRQIASKALLPFRVKPPDVSDVCGASSKRGDSRWRPIAVGCARLTRHQARTLSGPVRGWKFSTLAGELGCFSSLDISIYGVVFLWQDVISSRGIHLW